jgi:hypothetical protein
MKRTNNYDAAKHNAKRRKYGAANTILAEKQILYPFITVDVIKHWVIPFGALDWLFISKETHQTAIYNIFDDERVVARHDKLLKDAVVRRNFQLVERLLEDDRYTSSKNLEEAIGIALKDNDDEEVIEEDPKVREEDKKLAELLISHKLFAAIWPNNILTTAIERGWIEIVQHILATSKHTFENWYGAAMYGSAPVETLRLIRQDPRFYSSDRKTRKQLYNAISKGNLGAAILILEDERTNFESALRILSQFTAGVQILLADPRLIQSTYYQKIMWRIIADLNLIDCIIQDILEDSSNNPILWNTNLALRAITKWGDTGMVEKLLNDIRFQPTLEPLKRNPVVVAVDVTEKR